MAMLCMLSELLTRTLELHSSKYGRNALILKLFGYFKIVKQQSHSCECTWLYEIYALIL